MADINALIKRMTFAEKIGQISLGVVPWEIDKRVAEDTKAGRYGGAYGYTKPEIRAKLQDIARTQSRLGIPLIFGYDDIHGYTTVMPIPLGQAATWDPELVRQGARISAKEVSATGVNWTYSPMVDIARDPRWGRIAEGYGEDPFLASSMGAATVRGYQGSKLTNGDSIAACPKHYVGYGAAEGGRDYNTTWIPENVLREIYLPSFHACVEAGALTLMSAFNNINGVPASGNAFTLKQILRKEWGLRGFVVSDFESVKEMVVHGYAADNKDAALKGLNGGVDMEMVSHTYWDYSADLIKESKLNPKVIDDAVRHILYVKMKLGLWDRNIESGPPRVAPSQEARDTTFKLAKESIVLLKNHDALLPLAKSVHKVAVIGFVADSAEDQDGTWSDTPKESQPITVLAALKQRLGEANVTYVQGLKGTADTSDSQFTAARDAAASSDVALLVLGEEPYISGESSSRAHLELMGRQEDLIRKVSEAGKPIVLVLVAGRPVALTNILDNVDAVLFAWGPGTMGGPAIVGTLFGDNVPSGKLPVTFPRSVGQVPIYYNHYNTGRPAVLNAEDHNDYKSRYIDEDFRPFYPFGYGLSYTKFSYSKTRIDHTSVPIGSTFTLSAEVKNVGSVAADEIVQCYVHQKSGSVTRPVRELKGFRRIHLAPGESKPVSFPLNTRDMAYYNPKMRLVNEPAACEAWIAPDSTKGIPVEFRIRS